MPPGFLKKVFGAGGMRRGKSEGPPTRSLTPSRQKLRREGDGRPPLDAGSRSDAGGLMRLGTKKPGGGSAVSSSRSAGSFGSRGKKKNNKKDKQKHPADVSQSSGYSSSASDSHDGGPGRSVGSGNLASRGNPPTSVVVTTAGIGSQCSVSPPATSCNNSIVGDGALLSGEDDNSSHGHDSVHSGTSSNFKLASLRRNGSFASSNPKSLSHSTSAIGLDEMIEDRREGGHLGQNVVHIEVPFGKPIEEVYDGVHNGPVLGSGISGMVRLVTHKATGIKYAVKVLDLGLVETPMGLQQLREEIFIMCQLDHPNIVRLEEVYESHTEIYLVQELCLGGELFDRLDEQPDYHYTEAECARLVKQMLSAVRYLHSKGIIHRDLKLENFLFSSVHPDSELKMIDFGLSKHFRYGEVHHEAVGTPYTVAPEVIRGSYDERCDIWAIGVITFLLLSGEPPFGGCGGPEPLMTVRSNILNGRYSFAPPEIWELVTPAALRFIQSLLVTDPKLRPTAKAAQQHEWFRNWAHRNREDNDHVLNPNVVKALVNFKEFSDMRKLLCEVLSFTLLPDQIRDLRREFEKIDKDGSGEISLSSLKQVLMQNAGSGSLGALTEEEVTDIFDAMRVRKTETRIHWHEFIAAGLSQCSVDDRNLRLAFERLDADHKGYITLDDIMDLMGSDALQSEEAMRRMWGDSIKAVKCQHARITYDDFLLLMKGQTRDHPPHDPSRKLAANAGAVASKEAIGSSLRNLHVVPESNTLESVATPVAGVTATPLRAPVSQSAPSTPADHKKLISMDEDEFDSPLSMDDEMPVSVSLTPPSTPERSARVYFSPRDTDGSLLAISPKGSALLFPEFNEYDQNIRRRSRSLGEQVDNHYDDFETKDPPALNSSDVSDADADLNAVAHTVRDLLLPEHDHGSRVPGLEEVVKDKTKSALVVNRKLYRAHRQMRLAVLEASKRFEEQQAQHAREIILAQREQEVDQHVFHAGLVMRHGHSEQVSSEAIRAMLAKDRAEQQSLVEKANKRGGRGRRSRKKTISDMSGMLNGMSSEEFSVATGAASGSHGCSESQIEAPLTTSLRSSHSSAMAPAAAEAATAAFEDPCGIVSEPFTAVIPSTESSGVSGEAEMLVPPKLARGVTAPTQAATVSKSAPPESIPSTNNDKSKDIITAKEGTMRGATVPGDFRSTSDPFGSQGKYGCMSKWG